MKKTLQEKIDKFFKSGDEGIKLWNRYLKIIKLDFRSANFRSANFSSANFSFANFRSANFSSADFRSADFRSADFSFADFSSANFSFADFSSANFSFADFRSANFSFANFRSADFRFANFRFANFRSANFSSANFRSANFSFADFSSANFRSADFSFADFDSADFENYKINETTIGLTLACPQDGSYIAWKRSSNYIVKLFIPEKAKRSSATTAKCRASKAKCLAIENIDGTKSNLEEIVSNYDKNFIYKVGEYIKVSDFDDNRWNECSTGIHHFLSRKLAECRE